MQPINSGSKIRLASHKSGCQHPDWIGDRTGSGTESSAPRAPSRNLVSVATAEKEGPLIRPQSIRFASLILGCREEEGSHSRANSQENGEPGTLTSPRMDVTIRQKCNASAVW